MANRPRKRPRLASGRGSAYSGPSNSQTRDIQLLLQAQATPRPEAYQVARDTIDRIIRATKNSSVDLINHTLFILSSSLSIRALSGYATLDPSHIENIEAMISKIQRYADDTSQKRPLNFLMLAAPGAGKSHFIKCIAQQLGANKVSSITFNMTALQTNEDLIPALDAARNLKVEDRIPLLFLDEFDSKISNVSLLLPLLWDGELNLGQRDLKLGRVIIVLAGSDPTLPGVMESARSMRNEISLTDGNSPKIVDLLSRINGGVIEIPAFYDPTHSIDRRADKACVTMQLLRLRFGPTLKTVPRALLRLVVDIEFRYGVRRIAHLVDLIPYKKNVVRLRVKDLKLPVQSTKTLKHSSLAYHLLHEDQFTE